MSVAIKVMLAVLLVCAVGWAQLPTATMNGAVTDPQGAVVAGAKITLTHPATGATREGSTSSDGGYVFTNLAAGTYTMRVEAQGFATQEVKDIGLEVGRADTLNVSLKVAAGGEVITVTSNEAAVELTPLTTGGGGCAPTLRAPAPTGHRLLDRTLHRAPAPRP